MLARYDRLLNTRPLVTKVTTATAISVCTDIGLQRFTSRQPHTHDVHRTVRQATWSGPIMATMLHHWMNVLATIPSWGPLPAPIVRLAVDTFTLMPFSHVLYIGYLSAAEHSSPDRVASDLREKLGPLLRAGYATIPPVMLVNLWVIPLRFRVLFLNLVLGVGYGAFLNWQVNRREAGSSE